jgi:hypothetical protein
MDIGVLHATSAVFVAQVGELVGKGVKTCSVAGIVRGKAVAEAPVTARVESTGETSCGETVLDELQASKDKSRPIRIETRTNINAPL